MIRTRDLHPLSHTAVVFDGMLLEFSPLLRFQPAAERNLITAFTRSDKLEGEDDGLMILGSDVGGSRRINGVTDRQTDGRLFSFIYIDVR